ncbi:hypothetical protein CRV24_002130 [Beauveria bassiana]|nr:hypothetical protein CRV24_002130 [Beauveria bassiana]KAH8717489.1 hypothetical protein HC256_002174 [Beauveria bassiana]
MVAHQRMSINPLQARIATMKDVGKPTLYRLSTSAQQYFASPLSAFKDILLICLSIPGLLALLYPKAVCDTGGPRQSTPATASLAGPTPLGTCNCGTSVAEARAMGCKYDALSSAWLPARCIDEELSREFEMAGPGPSGRWSYWKDINLTEELSVSELGDYADVSGFEYHTTQEWHFVHCIFYWRKQYRSRYNHIWVEPRYNSEHHINHCTGVFRGGMRGISSSGVALRSDPWPGWQ